MSYLFKIRKQCTSASHMNDAIIQVWFITLFKTGRQRVVMYVLSTMMFIIILQN